MKNKNLVNDRDHCITTYYRTKMTKISDEIYQDFIDQMKITPPKEMRIYKKNKIFYDPYLNNQLQLMIEQLNLLHKELNSLDQVKKAMTLNSKDVGNVLRNKTKTPKGWSVEFVEEED